jgi:hypothetical protein
LRVNVFFNVKELLRSMGGFLITVLELVVKGLQGVTELL